MIKIKLLRKRRMYTQSDLSTFISVIASRRLTKRKHSVFFPARSGRLMPASTLARSQKSSFSNGRRIESRRVRLTRRRAKRSLGKLAAWNDDVVLRVAAGGSSLFENGRHENHVSGFPPSRRVVGCDGSARRERNAGRASECGDVWVRAMRR